MSNVSRERDDSSRLLCRFPEPRYKKLKLKTCIKDFFLYEELKNRSRQGLVTKVFINR